MAYRSEALSRDHYAYVQAGDPRTIDVEYSYNARTEHGVPWLARAIEDTRRCEPADCAGWWREVPLTRAIERGGWGMIPADCEYDLSRPRRLHFTARARCTSTGWPFAAL